jgi:cell fate regulator YaaT (PSP1 superfamily)
VGPAQADLYFTAEKRVDFRALVRDLAALFRTRIELKQIGVRDEAKRSTASAAADASTARPPGCPSCAR